MNFLDFKNSSVSEITEKITGKGITESQCLNDLREIKIKVQKLNEENKIILEKIEKVNNDISELQS